MDRPRMSMEIYIFVIMGITLWIFYILLHIMRVVDIFGILLIQFINL